MFVDTANEIVRNADIERAADFAGEDVNPIAAVDAHWRFLWLLDRPVKPGDDSFGSVVRRDQQLRSQNRMTVCVVAEEATIVKLRRNMSSRKPAKTRFS